MQRGKGLEALALFGLRQRRIGRTARTAVDSDRLHQDLEAAPVVRKLADDEVDEAVDL